MKVLYQTLMDRDNIDYVEKHGPFLCNAKNAWLGNGYYYWDTFIEYAKWWGKTRYSREGFIICESKVDFRRVNVLDLDDPEVLMDIFDIENEWYARRKERPKVPQIIEFLKNNTSFNYQAIRARVQGATNDFFLTNYKMNFIPHHSAYLDLMPQIQVCILDKKIIGEDNFHIVYPPEYADGFVI